MYSMSDINSPRTERQHEPLQLGDRAPASPWGGALDRAGMIEPVQDAVNHGVGAAAVRDRARTRQSLPPPGSAGAGERALCGWPWERPGRDGRATSNE
jgi:hypothetical protein